MMSRRRTRSEIARCNRPAWWLFSALIPALLLGCAGDDPAERLARAADQFSRGDYRVAAIELRNVLQEEPDNLQARLLFGQTSLMLGDLETAERSLARARDMGAPPEDYALALAFVLSQLGQPAVALSELERVPEGARDADWFSARGEVSAAQGELATAEEAVRQALAMDPEHYRATLGMARIATLRQAWPDAQQWLERAIELQPELPEGYMLRAEVRLQSGNAAAAERDLVRATELMSGGPVTARELNALAMLARLQLALNRTQALEAAAARLRSRAPGSPEAHYVGGAADYIVGRHEQAHLKLQQAAAQAPENLDIAMLLSANHLALGNFGQAEQHAQLVVSQRPEDAAAARLLAEVRRRQGRPRVALEGLRGVPDTDSNPGVLALRGLLHVELGEPERGAALLERAAQGLPEDSGVLLQLARAYLAAGRTQDATRLFEGPVGAGADEALEVALQLLTEVAAGDQELDAVRTRGERLIEENPEDVQRLMGVALFRHAVGDREAGNDLLQRAAEVDPAFAPARLLLAALAATGGDAEGARAIYQSIVDRSPDNYRAWLGLARLAAAEQAIDEARELSGRAAAADPDALAPALLLAQLSLSQGDSAGARAALDDARRIDPAHADVETLAGVLAVQRQDHEAAVEYFRRAAEKESNRADRWYNLGRAQRAAGDIEGARAALERAMTLAPSNGPARLELAQVERTSGNAAAARGLAQGLQADFPEAPEGYLLEATILAGGGDDRRAVPLFDEAYELRPSFEAAFGSYQSRRRAELDDAAGPLRSWLEATPDDARAWLALADFHQTQGQSSDALAGYERVIELQPGNVAALNNAAWLYNEAGDQRALDHARRAFEAAPQAAPVLDTYGWVLVRQGRAQEGLPYLRQAVELAPQARDIQYHLAYGLVQIGEHAEARSLLDGVLGDTEGFSYREQAEALLAEL